ncbi:MAG: hypothetical protein ACLPP9_04865 [Smithella sp.]
MNEGPELLYFKEGRDFDKMTENLMTRGSIIALILLTMIALITAGCTTTQSSSTSTASASETFSSSDPSAPASYAEKYCLDVVSTNVGKIQYSPSGKAYYPIISISAAIKSNCNYPVQGTVQLWAYDENNNLIKSAWPSGVQDAQAIYIKPGETKSFSSSFDIRSIPDNPRDSNPNPTATFKVTAFVTRIVSAREAAGW